MPPAAAASVPRPSGRASVVLVTHEFAPFRGGAATYVQEVAGALGELGFHTEIWTVDYANRRDLPRAGCGLEASTPGHIESSANPTVVRLSSNGRLSPASLFAFGWALAGKRQALRGKAVLLMSVGAQMVFFWLGQLRIVPPGRTIAFFHGSEILRFGRHPIWRWLARRHYAAAGGLAVNSEHVADMLRNSGLVPADARIEVAPCALPAQTRETAQAFAESAASAGERRVADGNSWRILTVARLHARKGQSEVIAALARLPEALRVRIIYQLVGVGETAYRQELEIAARAGGVRLEWLGALDEAALARVYAGATLCAQASRTLPRSIEGFGLTFLEAACHGLPVAAFRSGGIGEAVIDGETGLLVPEDDVTGLAAAIERLLTEPELRRRLGEAGRARALATSWQTAAGVLGEAATRLIQDGPEIS